MGIGITMTISLYGILEALGVDHNNKKLGKIACWTYVSLFVFGLCMLAHVLGE
jgi:hypothetical protein